MLSQFPTTEKIAATGIFDAEMIRQYPTPEPPMRTTVPPTLSTSREIKRRHGARPSRHDSKILSDKIWFQVRFRPTEPRVGIHGGHLPFVRIEGHGPNHGRFTTRHADFQKINAFRNQRNLFA